MLKLSKEELDSIIIEDFEQFFLSIPDVDETLLNKVDGKYTADFIEAYYYFFEKGARSTLINMIARRELQL